MFLKNMEKMFKIRAVNEVKATDYGKMDFLPFIVDMHKKITGETFIVKNFHEELAELFTKCAYRKLDNGYLVIVNMPPRFSKAIDCATPMWTPDGWKSAAEIRVGDKLLGSNGQWTSVQGVYPQGIKPAFNVKFSDKSSLVTCDEHLWTVRLRGKKDRKDKAPWRIKNTEELRNDLQEADGRKKWRIPVLLDTNNKDVELPIDPYLFGCWLGDGSSSEGAITTMDAEIIAAFHAYNPKPLRYQNSGRATTYRLYNGFRTNLRLLGALNNKHIPLIYMQGSHAQRLSLLQGIADTDGWAAKNGLIAISSSKKNLSDDIRSLINSLGGVWRGYTWQPPIGKLSYTTGFSLQNGDIPFRLPRKISKLKIRSERNSPRRFIDSIEPVEPREMVCFKVAAPDSLFCAGKNFIVTHNTLFLIYYMAWCFLKNPAAKFIYASYSQKLSLKTSREVKNILYYTGQKSNFSKDSNELWELKGGGALWSTSIQGSVTGFGAGTLDPDVECAGDLICDDANKISDTFYQVMRDTVNDNFISTFWSRRNNMDRVPIIVVQQRVHTEDLSGFLMKDSKFKYTNYVLKAIGDDGKSTFPERVSLDTLAELKAASPYTFSAQQQQSPQEYSGGFFDVSKVEIITPNEFRKREYYAGKIWVRAWDFAGTSKKSMTTEKHDWTRGVLACTDGKKMYITHMASHRGTVEQNAILLVKTACGDGPRVIITVPEDTNTAGAAYVDYLQNLPELTGFSLNPIRPTHNKQLRAAGMASFLNMGNVVVVDDSEDDFKWNGVLLSELASFPTASHDDCVDCLSDLFTYMHNIMKYI